MRGLKKLSDSKKQTMPAYNRPPYDLDDDFDDDFDDGMDALIGDGMDSNTDEKIGYGMDDFDFDDEDYASMGMGPGRGLASRGGMGGFQPRGPAARGRGTAFGARPGSKYGGGGFGMGLGGNDQDDDDDDFFANAKKETSGIKYGVNDDEESESEDEDDFNFGRPMSKPVSRMGSTNQAEVAEAKKPEPAHPAVQKYGEDDFDDDDSDDSSMFDFDNAKKEMNQQIKKKEIEAKIEEEQKQKQAELDALRKRQEREQAAQEAEDERRRQEAAKRQSPAQRSSSKKGGSGSKNLDDLLGDMDGFGSVEGGIDLKKSGSMGRDFEDFLGGMPSGEKMSDFNNRLSENENDHYSSSRTGNPLEQNIGFSSNGGNSIKKSGQNDIGSMGFLNDISQKQPSVNSPRSNQQSNFRKPPTYKSVQDYGEIQGGGEKRGQTDYKVQDYDVDDEEESSDFLDPNEVKSNPPRHNTKNSNLDLAKQSHLSFKGPKLTHQPASHPVAREYVTEALLAEEKARAHNYLNQIDLGDTKLNVLEKDFQENRVERAKLEKRLEISKQKELEIASGKNDLEVRYHQLRLENDELIKQNDLKNLKIEELTLINRTLEKESAQKSRLLKERQDFSSKTYMNTALEAQKQLFEAELDNQGIKISMLEEEKEALIKKLKILEEGDPEDAMAAKGNQIRSAKVKNNDLHAQVYDLQDKLSKREGLAAKENGGDQLEKELIMGELLLKGLANENERLIGENRSLKSRLNPSTNTEAGLPGFQTESSAFTGRNQYAKTGGMSNYGSVALDKEQEYLESIDRLKKELQKKDDFYKKKEDNHLIEEGRLQEVETEAKKLKTLLQNSEKERETLQLNKDQLSSRLDELNDGQSLNKKVKKQILDMQQRFRDLVQEKKEAEKEAQRNEELLKKTKKELSNLKKDSTRRLKAKTTQLKQKEDEMKRMSADTTPSFKKSSNTRKSRKSISKNKSPPKSHKRRQSDSESVAISETGIIMKNLVDLEDAGFNENGSNLQRQAPSLSYKREIVEATLRALGETDPLKQVGDTVDGLAWQMSKLQNYDSRKTSEDFNSPLDIQQQQQKPINLQNVVQALYTKTGNSEILRKDANFLGTLDKLRQVSIIDEEEYAQNQGQDSIQGSGLSDQEQQRQQQQQIEQKSAIATNLEEAFIDTMYKKLPQILAQRKLVNPQDLPPSQDQLQQQFIKNNFMGGTGVGGSPSISPTILGKAANAATVNGPPGPKLAIKRLERDNESLMDEVKALQEERTKLKNIIRDQPRNAKDIDFAILERKLDILEKNTRTRNLDLHNDMKTMMNPANLGLNNTQSNKQWTREKEKLVAVIKRFRHELDNLLLKLAEIKANPHLLNQLVQS